MYQCGKALYAFLSEPMHIYHVVMSSLYLVFAIILIVAPTRLLDVGFASHLPSSHHIEYFWPTLYILAFIAQITCMIVNGSRGWIWPQVRIACSSFTSFVTGFVATISLCLAIFYGGDFGRPILWLTILAFQLLSVRFRIMHSHFSAALFLTRGEKSGE